MQDAAAQPGVGADGKPVIHWGETFHQFSVTHAVAVVCCAGVIWAVVRVGRRHRRLNNLARGVVDGPGELLGVLLIAYWVVLQLWWNFPHRPMRDSWLPLQLCDLAGLVGGLALMTGKRWLNATTYFWAFALSTQAFFTPIIHEGPATARFWLFFESHTAIVGSAVYIVAVRGYRPRWPDVLMGIGMTVAYVAAVLPLDLAFDWNYGYVGPGKPGAPTLVDRLGPWPWRLAPLAGLGVGAMLLVWMPWIVADKFGKKRADASPSPPDEGEGK